MRPNLKPIVAAVSLILISGSGGAQTPDVDPSVRLRQVLPPQVAQQVLTTIAAARSKGLPAQALESRALKYAARGVNPGTIRDEIAAQARRMESARDLLQSGRGRTASGDEIEAGADVLGKGVNGGTISELARQAPAGRSLAVPLFVLGSLVDRGLSSDDALRRVLERLQARASDRDLENLPGQVAAGRGNRPENTGRGARSGGRPAGAGQGASGTAGPPGKVPVGPGASGRPAPPRGRP